MEALSNAAVIMTFALVLGVSTAFIIMYQKGFFSQEENSGSITQENSNEKLAPKRIILVRHGQSEGNIDRLNYATIPDHALKLTDYGKVQAQEAGDEIKKIIGSSGVYAYVSPFYRTRQTFEQIATVLGDRVENSIEDPRIREQEWGHLRHPDENNEMLQARDEYSTFYYRIKDGESGADVFNRVSTFLETMHRDFKKPDYPDNALIVTHGFTLRIFLMRWLHWTVEEFERVLNPENCAVVVLERQSDGRYVLETPLRSRDE